MTHRNVQQALSDPIRLFLTLFSGGGLAHSLQEDANERVQHICIWLGEMSADRELEGICGKALARTVSPVCDHGVREY